MTSHRVVDAARIRWNGRQPVSAAFGDIYCDGDGVAEAERVFVAPARLVERSAGAGVFTVGELGFGFGTNFAVVAERVLRGSNARLHYIAFEAAPVPAADLRRAARHTGLATQRELAAAPPPRISGWHRRRFAAGRVQLSLFFGDVREGLADLEGRCPGMDAWFLDGFAPPRNPAMWRHEVCVAVAALCRPGATATTYSSAGVVKAALRSAGFHVERVDQRPRKRHSLLGTYPGQWSPVPARLPDVAVLGAGLAGANAARALAERGVAVTVRDAAVAAGASGIPGAALHPRLLADGGAAAAWRAHSYAFAVWRYGELPGVRRTGALQLPGPNVDADRLLKIAAALPDDWCVAVGPRDAAELAGLGELPAGLHFPHAAVVSGRSLCAALLDHPRIEFQSMRGDAPAWAGGSVEAAATVQVLASGAAVATALPELEVTGLLGQADLFAGGLRMPVLGDGYCTPAGAACWTGATYEYRPWAAGAATRANGRRFEALFQRPPGPALASFRGTRAVTSDRVPIIGRVDAATYLTSGHGSAGVASAALAGEWIASLICGETPPVTREVEALCRVGRFRERQQRRPNPFLPRSERVDRSPRKRGRR